MATKINPSEIAALAYQLFEQQGCPHGRDMDHWLEAEMLLLKSKEAKPAKISDAKVQPKNTKSPTNYKTSNKTLAHLTR